jgi:hypothetical protein
MMKTKWIGGMVLVALVSLVVGGMLAQRGIAEDKLPGKSKGGAHYTVVETEGHNLIVTDNQTDTLYFYTIDKDAKIGSDLKLRGKVDLKQVGKESIKPTGVKLQK